MSIYGLVLFWEARVHAATIAVGPAGAFATPCRAFAAAADGDRVEIDAAGNYSGDVCGITRSRLTIVGVGSGRAKIDANGKNALGKGIWVVQGDDTTIENVELSGARVPDQNGAGIRQEGKNLTVRNCFFHDNEDGILAGDVTGSAITIESSEFDRNGAGDGYSHNLYINHVARLTFRYNYSHRALVGHLLKTRAAENYILYNRLSGEAEGTESYELDVPNGGKTYVIGNVIEQGQGSQNPTMLAFLAEGAHASNPSHALFVINNSFVNDLGRGAFVSVSGTAMTEPVLRNNVFHGSGSVPSLANTADAHNHVGGSSCFVNVGALDLALVAGSPCVDAGAEPGNDGTFALTPDQHYVHPANHAARVNVGVIDIGAYEYDQGAGRTSFGGKSAGGAASAGGTLGSAGASGGTSGGGRGAASGGFAGGGASGLTTGGASDGGTPAASMGGAASSVGTGDRAESGCNCRLQRGASRSYAFALSLAVATAFAYRRRRRPIPISSPNLPLARKPLPRGPRAPCAASRRR